MTKHQTKIPKRRFKGFTGEWEEKKLGEVVSVTMGQSPNSVNYTDNPSDHVLVQGNADMNNNRVVPRVWTTQVTKQADKGDLILSVRAPVGDVGKTDYDVVIGRGVAALKGNEFIYQSLVRMKEYGYWTRLSTGSTFESINSNDIKEAIIMLPSLEEQQKIGEFFSQLDQRIELQKSKIEKMKALKKAYLSEMFPAERETTPKRRFKGFTGEWEKRKLWEVTNSYSGGTPKVGKSEYYGGNIPFIRSAEINSDSTELFITELGLNNSSAKMIEIGYILYALYGATSGEVGISRIKGAINQAILAIIPKSGYDTQFITQWLRREKYKIIDKYLQGGQGNLSGSIVKNLEVMFPSLEEQQKIGEFFSEMEEMIELHEEKLKKLQNLKQAYLNELLI